MPTLSPTLPLALTADPNPIPNQIVAAKLLVPSARWLPSPLPEHPLFATLLALSHGWVHLLTLTTFTTTFFLGHAHAFWNKCALPAPQRQPSPSPQPQPSPQPHLASPRLTSPHLTSPHPTLRRCYLLSRVIQGRLNDVGMLCGSHAARTAEGIIEPEAAAVLTQALP